MPRYTAHCTVTVGFDLIAANTDMARERAAELLHTTLGGSEHLEVQDIAITWRSEQ